MVNYMKNNKMFYEKLCMLLKDSIRSNEDVMLSN